MSLGRDSPNDKWVMLKKKWHSYAADGVTYNENEMARKGCSGALLDMLAEVASRTLHSDPSVKSPVKRPALKIPEINYISNKRKQRTPCRGRTGEGEMMELEQLQSLTANHLLKLFSEFDGDEIRRTFTFTCFIEPEQCHQQFSSFGSEGKARQQMKSHLLEHVHQLELKAERGFELRIEPVKVRRRRLAEALHINRRHKNGTKIKVEPIIKSEPVDENDSSVPNKENNVSSVLENYPVVKLNQKTEKLINPETVENVKNTPETENMNDSCTVQDNSVVGRACDAEEKNNVDERSHGIYDEHNYVAIDSDNVTNNITATVSDEDEKKCKGTESKLKPIFGYDLQKQEKQDQIKKEPHVSDKSPAADIGKFMIAETLLDMVMVCVLEDDQLQLKQLPCVGQEIDVNTSQCAPYKMIRSEDLPVVQDNRKSDPQQYSDEVIREINCEKSIERDEYIQKKKPKGKAKFIGQSKAEKEMAIHLIETMKRKGNTESLECHICNPPRSFTAPTTLISHYRSHAGIKPYECRICHSVFTRQHSLNYHMLIHSNQTRFTCSDCGRKFRHPSHFKEHRRRHTGESPYECSDCMLRFKTRNTYKRHLKTRHGKVLTTSGGLIILSEEEFRQVRTLPRTPQSTSLIQIKQEQQIGKKKSRKGKARIKIGGKKRRLEPYEVMKWKQMDEEPEGNELNYDDESLREATASISIPAVEIDGHKSDLDELSCISNVENEITLPLSKHDTCEKSFQDIVEEAMRQSSISFTDETDDKVNDKANVVVLDVPVANTENLYGSKDDQFENELSKIPSEDDKSGWNMVGPQQKGREKNKAEQKSNSKNTSASQLRPKSSKKSLILPNNVAFNPLVINTGLNQSQTMSAILTTTVQTSTFNSPTSSTAFLSKSSVLSQLDADVIKFVNSDRLNVATSNTQQTTIMLLTEDCTSFTTQRYIVNEVEKNSERVLGVPQV